MGLLRVSVVAPAFLGLVLPAAGASASEFAPFDMTEMELGYGADFKAHYFDEQGAPNVKLVAECPEDGEGDCWQEVRNGQGQELDSYGSDDSVSVIAGARYKDRAYLLVSNSYECGDDYCTDRFLYRNDGHSSDVPGSYNNGFQGQNLDLTVTHDGQLLGLTSKAMVKAQLNGDVERRVEAPQKLTHGRIENDLTGRQAAIGVGSGYGVWLTNGRQWFSGDIRLAEHGDRRGILGAHPGPDGGAIGVVYRYMNPYNKGVYLTKVGPGIKEAQSGPVLLSTERNIGFDPRIVLDEGVIHIVAKDSTNEKKVSIRVPKGELDDLPQPRADQFSTGEWWATFWAGAGIQIRNWQAQSKVEEIGDPERTDTLTQVDYEIEKARLRTYQLQGRVGETRLALTYLKEQTKDRIKTAADNDVAAKASEYLIGKISWKGLFSPSSGLRLAYRKSKTGGIAKLQEKNGATNYRPFTTEYMQVGTYVTQERGDFYGLEYTDYSMPSAVGFSDSSKNVVFSGFDSDLGLEKWSLIAGYDPEAYAKRYETNYFDWFVSGKGGLGVGWAHLSSDLKSRAKSETGEDKINSPIFLAFDGTLETGVLWQRRYRNARGLGYQIVAGYQAQGTYMGTGQTQDSESSDGLTLEFTRYDFWHGPFVRANVIF